MPAHRIISLIASATEIVCALGHEAELVGISHECDFPPTVTDRPACSKPRIDIHAGSLAIDVAVKEQVGNALSVYEVFADRLEELQATVIVTQTQCEVCAVSLKDVEAAVCEWTSSRPRIVSCEPMTLPDVWSDIQRVADALDDSESGQQLIAKCQTALDTMRSETSSQSRRKSVACVEWLDPVMIAANWVPELVRIAGGEPILTADGQHSPYVEWEALREADPDVIAIMPCGFDILRTLDEMHLLTERPGWSDLSAVRNGQVYVTDGNSYFNRPGPRVVESAMILREILTESGWPSGLSGEGFRSFPED